MHLISPSLVDDRHELIRSHPSLHLTSSCESHHHHHQQLTATTVCSSEASTARHRTVDLPARCIQLASIYPKSLLVFRFIEMNLLLYYLFF